MLSLRHQCVVALAKAQSPMEVFTEPVMHDVLYEIDEIKKNTYKVIESLATEIETIQTTLKILTDNCPVDTNYYDEVSCYLFQEIFEYWDPTEQDELYDYFVSLYRAVSVTIDISSVSDVTKLCDAFKYWDLIPKPVDPIEDARSDRISNMFEEMKREHELLVKEIGDPMELIRSRQKKMVELREREREINNQIYEYQIVLDDIRAVDQWVVRNQLENMEL